MPEGSPTKQLTTTEHALLGMLARYGRSGYTLLREAEEGIGFFWSPAKSHVYEVLPRLEQRGLARRRVRTPDRQARQSISGRLTARGRATLRRWIEHPRTGPIVHLSVLLLEAVLRRLRRSRRAGAALIERFRDQLSERLSALRHIGAEAVFAAPQELPRGRGRCASDSPNSRPTSDGADTRPRRSCAYDYTPPRDTISRSDKPTTRSERR